MPLAQQHDTLPLSDDADRETPINTLLEPGTSYTDTNVQPGATYFYVVTAVDDSGQESNFSNEAKAIIPTP